MQMPALIVFLDGEDLEKAHIKAHFRRTENGKLAFIKDYDRRRYPSKEVAAVVRAGDKVTVNNPKSRFHGKDLDVLHYSDTYDCVRCRHPEGKSHTADFDPNHLIFPEKVEEPEREANFPVFENISKMRAGLVAAFKKAGITYAPKPKGGQAPSINGITVSMPDLKTIEVSVPPGLNDPASVERVLKEGNYDYAPTYSGFTINTANHFFPEQHEAHEYEQAVEATRKLYHKAHKKNNYKSNDPYVLHLSKRLRGFETQARSAQRKAKQAYDDYRRQSMGKSFSGLLREILGRVVELKKALSGQ